MAGVLSMNEIILRDFIYKIRNDTDMINMDLDYGYTSNGKNYMIYAVRPDMDDIELKANSTHPLAKIAYRADDNTWRLWWNSPSREWTKYKPHIFDNFYQVLESVEEDEVGFFFG